jgi:hypothetical protein
MIWVAAPPPPDELELPEDAEPADDPLAEEALPEPPDRAPPLLLPAEVPDRFSSATSCCRSCCAVGPELEPARVRAGVVGL